MVKNDLDKAGIINKIPSGAIVTGGGAMTIGVEEASKRILSLPTRVANPEGVGGLIDDIQDARFATAIGLILYGMQSEESTTQPRKQSPIAMPNLPGKMKIPSAGGLGKIIDTIKDLLP